MTLNNRLCLAIIHRRIRSLFSLVASINGKWLAGGEIAKTMPPTMMRAEQGDDGQVLITGRATLQIENHAAPALVAAACRAIAHSRKASGPPLQDDDITGVKPPST